MQFKTIEEAKAADIKMIKLKKDGWHFKIQKYVFKNALEADPSSIKNLCPYFWMLVMAIMIAPFKALFSVISWPLVKLFNITVSAFRVNYDTWINSLNDSQIYDVIHDWSVPWYVVHEFAKKHSIDDNYDALELITKKVKEKYFPNDTHVSSNVSLNDFMKKIREKREIYRRKLEEQREIKKEEKLIVSIEPTIPNRQKRHKDKLAIIIDDVTYKKHLDFDKLGMNINLSFLPPTHGHPSSAKLAKKMDNYLVHLPCQAKSKFFKEEENTLHIYDDYSTIENRIYELKTMYPKAKVMNNHTGSLFTQDKASMDRLMRALQKYDLKFIDSRTTAKSVANRYADKYGVPILSRNVFLDNKRDKEFIKENIVKSVKLAHRFSQAIAIGHPYKLTLQSIEELRDYLENEVELVLVNRLDYNNE